MLLYQGSSRSNELDLLRKIRRRVSDIQQFDQCYVGRRGLILGRRFLSKALPEQSKIGVNWVAETTRKTPFSERYGYCSAIEQLISFLCYYHCNQVVQTIKPNKTWSIFLFSHSWFWLLFFRRSNNLIAVTQYTGRSRGSEHRNEKCLATREI